MATYRITVRISAALKALLRDRCRVMGQATFDVVRVALETYLGCEGSQRSAYELAKEAGLVGCADRAPKDLSTNRLHFETFGTKRLDF